MSAPRVGVARIRDGHVQVSYHRQRHAVVDERGRHADFAAINQPPAVELNVYPGPLPSPLTPVQDWALLDRKPDGEAA